jgi:hypothetical protein
MDEAPRIVALIPGYQEGPRIAAVVEASRDPEPDRLALAVRIQRDRL